MNDYAPYVMAVYLLSFVVYGGYTLRWHMTWKKTQKQLDESGGHGP